VTLPTLRLWRLLRRHFHRWTLARRTTALLFLALLVLGSFTWFPWMRGSASATVLFDAIPFVDPLAALEAAAASRTITWTTAIGAGLVIATAVVLGPAFCGWLCPLGLLLDVNQAVRERIVGRTGRPVTPNPPPAPAARLAVLAAVLAFALVSAVPVFQVISPINLVVRAVVFASTGGLIAIGVLLAIEWIRPRVWCRALCPLGGLYGVIGRHGVLRVRVDRRHAARSPCRRCTSGCPMGIRVLEEVVARDRDWVDHPACTRCGACADACPRDVLRLGLRGVPRTPDGAPPPCACEIEES
jgi:ferredoxin-type protein NapH